MESTIPNFSRYKISSDGDLYGINGRKMKLFKTAKGYFRTSLVCDDGKKRTMLIHRLVAMTFIPEVDDKPYINHKDGNKTNNKIDNLEWCTVKENNIHAYKNGLARHFVGEDHGNSKLNNKTVLSIRSTYKKGKISYQSLAEKYGVGKSMIGYIIQNKNWKHI